MSRKLTPKQQRFIEEFLIDVNASRAATRSGYSSRCSKEIGHENLTKPHILEGILKAMKERSERTKIDADYVLTQAVKLHERCMQEVRPLPDNKGNHQQDEDGNYLFVFNANGAARALELIGKHTSIQCFKEKRGLSGDVLPTVIIHDPGRFLKE
jgi:phage terminase small subunit